MHFCLKGKQSLPPFQFYEDDDYRRRRLDDSVRVPRPEHRPHPLRYRRLEAAPHSRPAAVPPAKKPEAASSDRKEKVDDDAEEEEPGVADMEDVEYEDAYVSERPPMTFQLKEDTERDEFMYVGFPLLSFTSVPLRESCTDR